MSNVSFRITNQAGRGRPSSSSAPRVNRRRSRSGSGSSSDEDGNFTRRKGESSRGRGDESVTSIDKHGVRSSTAAKKEKPLVIPALPNKDFRRAAIELRAKKEGRAAFVPGQSTPEAGENGRPRRQLTEAERMFLESNSHVQTIGNGVVTGGIRQRDTQATPVPDERAAVGAPNGIGTNGDTDMAQASGSASVTSGMSAAPDLDANALALQELLATHSDAPAAPKVSIIPQVTEDDAFAFDVDERPDIPTLDDYARVPIEDFGAALLRGMTASNPGKKREKVEAYIPKSRTALLGIGAKSREETFGPDLTVGPGNAKKKPNKREEMRFMPLTKRLKSDAGSGPPSGSNTPLAIEAGSTQLNGTANGTPRRSREEDEAYEGSLSKRQRRDRDHEDDSRHRRRDRSHERARESDRRRRDYSDEDSENERRRRRREKEGRSIRDSSRERRKDRERVRDGDRDRESRRDRSRSRDRRRDRDNEKDRKRDRD